MDEVAQHSSYDSLWIVVDSKVYDITNYLGMHPGTQHEGPAGNPLEF